MTVEDMINVYRERLDICRKLLKVREKELVQEISVSADIETSLKNALDEIRQRKKDIVCGEMILETLEQIK